jgi:hypothetical protein
MIREPVGEVLWSSARAAARRVREVERRMKGFVEVGRM